MEVIAKPFGWLMLQLYNWTGNYGVAVILFALVVKLIMLPFQLKSKKSMMRMSRMTPRLKELEKKFGNDQQRYQQEMNKLYKEEGVNPMSGCLWSLIPFPILIALYRAIRFPLTTMMGVPSDLLAEGGAITTKLAELGYQLANYSTSRDAPAEEEIFQSQFMTDHFSAFQGLSEKLQEMTYQFLGLNLGQTPSVTFWNWDTVNWAHIGLFLIPIVSAALSYFSMRISNSANPQAGANNQQMKSMQLTMPLISLWICFTMPGIMGIYWISQSVFAIIQEAILTRVFNKQLDVEDADRLERERIRAAELEAKREETERLKAEGITVENKNTSKKNKKAVAAQKEAERKAAEARAERAKKRAARGIVDDIPASQVGNRRYARGRAYVPDRYTNPDEAEAKTLAAAEESAAYEDEHPAPIEDGEELAAVEEELTETGDEAAAALEETAGEFLPAADDTEEILSDADEETVSEAEETAGDDVYDDEPAEAEADDAEEDSVDDGEE